MSSSDDNKVAVLGLGIMGAALVKHFAEKGMEVHGWNRGTERRQAVVDLNLGDKVHVHESLADAIAPVTTVVINIAGDKNLQSVQNLIRSLPAEQWRGKTVVNFASQEPFSAKEVEKTLLEVGADHVAGALICVPETIGTPLAVVLVSPPERSEEAYAKVAPVLEPLGRLEKFDGDEGYGPLVDIGLILSAFFGVFGMEISLLAFELYGASKDVTDRFLAIGKELIPGYMTHFTDVTADTIRNKKWEGGGLMNLPAEVALFEMYQDFLTKLGVADDTIVGTMLKYYKKANAANPKHCNTAVVLQYKKD